MFDDIMPEIERRRAVAKKHKLETVWSLDHRKDITDFSTPHPYTGISRLAYEAHWGPDCVVVDIEGPTWLDLWRTANKAIIRSGDESHIYIERFSIAPSGVLELHTGS